MPCPGPTRGRNCRTATRTEIVAAMAKAASTDAAANVYQLTTRQVQAAVQFEDLLAA
jgi:uncharacterized protein (DUF433 family)